MMIMIVVSWMSVLIMGKPCRDEYKSRYCFPCISGLCPYGMDFENDCYPELDPEQQELFEELYLLRNQLIQSERKESYPPLVSVRLTGETK